MLDQEPHQPLGVENKLVSVSLLIPAEGVSDPGAAVCSSEAGLMWSVSVSASVRESYLMMVCIPRTCGVLSITLRVSGKG